MGIKKARTFAGLALINLTPINDLLKSLTVQK